MIEEVACTGAYACTANDGTQCSQGGVVWLAEECRVRDGDAGWWGAGDINISMHLQSVRAAGGRRDNNARYIFTPRAPGSASVHME